LQCYPQVLADKPLGAGNQDSFHNTSRITDN
jgi:hypothetical protein